MKHLWYGVIWHPFPRQPLSILLHTVLAECLANCFLINWFAYGVPTGHFPRELGVIGSYTADWVARMGGGTLGRLTSPSSLIQHKSISI